MEFINQEAILSSNLDKSEILSNIILATTNLLKMNYKESENIFNIVDSVLESSRISSDFKVIMLLLIGSNFNLPMKSLSHLYITDKVNNDSLHVPENIESLIHTKYNESNGNTVNYFGSILNISTGDYYYIKGRRYEVIKLPVNVINKIKSIIGNKVNFIYINKPIDTFIRNFKSFFNSINIDYKDFKIKCLENSLNNKWN